MDAREISLARIGSEAIVRVVEAAVADGNAVVEVAEMIEKGRRVRLDCQCLVDGKPVLEHDQGENG